MLDIRDLFNHEMDEKVTAEFFRALECEEQDPYKRYYLSAHIRKNFQPACEVIRALHDSNDQQHKEVLGRTLVKPDVFCKLREGGYGDEELAELFYGQNTAVQGGILAEYGDIGFLRKMEPEGGRLESVIDVQTSGQKGKILPDDDRFYDLYLCFGAEKLRVWCDDVESQEQRHKIACACKNLLHKVGIDNACAWVNSPSVQEMALPAQGAYLN